MPIVDGLTSTKMIRSFEKSHPTQLLSTRASLNGRVPIIAVSASLVERELQTYIDAGFDGWILKPISFSRLTTIMNGIVERDTRRDNLYKAGNWEHGGWFNEVQNNVFAADTRPSEAPPMEAPSKGVMAAMKSKDPFYKEENSSVQSQEQNRLAEEQAATAPKARSMPNLSGRGTESRDANVTEAKVVSSPRPMTPDPENG